MDRALIAQNFVATYGRAAFRQLLDDFASGVSGQRTADRLGVSRERVRQWRSAFGTTISVYQPHPDIERVVK